MADTRVTPLEITRKFLAVFHSNAFSLKISIMTMKRISVLKWVLTDKKLVLY